MDFNDADEAVDNDDGSKKLKKGIKRRNQQ